MVGYVTVAEECGALVDAGQMGRADAITRIQQVSDGGLTRLGAEDALNKWQTLRSRLADIGMRAEMGIAACQAKLREQEMDR
jgi:hypothetical protein